MIAAPNGEAALAALDRLHVPGADAVVESQQPLPSAGGQATLVHDRAGDIVIRVSTAAPGVLVLNEGYGDGGWSVTVDGKDQPLLRVNYLYQGVAVGGGEHIAHFHYRPRTFGAGALLSALATVIVLLLLAWPAARPRVVRRRRDRSTPPR